jgi:hypothetical protein
MNFLNFEKICLSYGLIKTPSKYGAFNYTYNSESPLWNRKEFANPFSLIKVETHSRIVIYDEFFKNEYGAVFNGSNQFLIYGDEISLLTEELPADIVTLSALAIAVVPSVAVKVT